MEIGADGGFQSLGRRRVLLTQIVVSGLPGCIIAVAICGCRTVGYEVPLLRPQVNVNCKDVWVLCLKALNWLILAFHRFIGIKCDLGSTLFGSSMPGPAGDMQICSLACWNEVESLFSPVVLALMLVAWRPLKNLHFFAAGYPFKQAQMADLFIFFPSGPPKSSWAFPFIIATQAHYKLLDEILHRSIIYHGALHLMGITGWPSVSCLVASAVTLGVSWKLAPFYTCLYLNMVYHVTYLYTGSIFASAFVQLSHDASVTFTYLLFIKYGMHYELEEDALSSETNRMYFKGAFVLDRKSCLPWRRRLIAFWRWVKADTLADYIENQIPKPPLSSGQRFQHESISWLNGLATTMALLVSTAAIGICYTPSGSLFPDVVRQGFSEAKNALFYTSYRYLGKWGATTLVGFFCLYLFSSFGSLLNGKRLEHSA